MRGGSWRVESERGVACYRRARGRRRGGALRASRKVSFNGLRVPVLGKEAKGRALGLATRLEPKLSPD